MATVRHSLEQFKNILEALEEEKEKYLKQKLNLEAQNFAVVEDCATSEIKDGGLQTETNRLLSRINHLKMEIVKWKVSTVTEYIRELQKVNCTAPRSATPSSLSLQYYHNWIDTDENLSLLQIQLLDIQQFLSSLKRRRQLLSKNLSTLPKLESVSEDHIPATQRLLVANTIANMQERVSSFVEQQSSDVTLFLNEIISPTHGKTPRTLVSSRVTDYIAECGLHVGDSSQPSLDPQGHPLGCHPDRYASFMEVLVVHLSETYGKRLDVTKDDIYLLLEDHVMPQVKKFALPYVRNLEWDQKVSENCRKFKHVTLGNLGLPDVECNALVPFLDAIAAIKASYFSPNPTRKMFAFVKAAKCVLDTLRAQIDPDKIDADTFLDAWVFVLIKANIKDLATTLSFMYQYGNPAFCNAEAGYYLTTSQVAMNFIMALTPDQLSFTKQGVFLSCERERFIELCSRSGCPLEVASSTVTLKGFKPALMPETASNSKFLFRHSTLVQTVHHHTSLLNLTTTDFLPLFDDCTRFVRSFLVETGIDSDSIDLISLKIKESMTEEQVCFVQRCFTTPPFEGIKLKDLPHGKIMVLDKEYVKHHGLPSNSLLTPTDKSVDEVFQLLQYINTLVQLDSNKLAFQPKRIVSSCGNHTRVTTDVYSRSVITPISKSLRNTTPATVKQVYRQTKDYAEMIGDKHVQSLESNFLANYFPEVHSCQNVKEKVKLVVTEVQVHLHMLNYLSDLQPASGFYTKATHEAVLRFQENMNRPGGDFPFVANGILTVSTRHQLRGQILEVTSQITQTGFPNFPDPSDVSEENVCAMRSSISQIQAQWGIAEKCRRGVFCAATLRELDRRTKRRLQRKKVYSV